ncbi:endonuclease/exonuclease/phosphatase family protein [Roseibium marinum]|uniref:Endonuclease/exonuclease/phosphatase (EEP) superfamily protein YafD n=1 Tax=Roseibium marinum TaxID=281252 RepID=A0A2S3UNZ9_9HYPH|nr:endonuclease/exonuclease/phosphatase family protein [Roseibium marinum]POF29426.1 endonuclease/exonuclease/phosphatase (EEP) superfamily protein YafD [Roseibium marinum]
MTLLTAILVILSAVCLAASLLPLIPVAHGLVRSFDFARLQVIGISILVFAAAVLGQLPHTAMITVSVMALTALAIQLVYVIPFTPVWFTQTARYAGDPDKAAVISLLVSNVKQGNRDYSRVTDLIAERTPDIAIFMETDQAWFEALRPTLSRFRHIAACPQSNTYGMILASRLPLRTYDVQFLLNEEVPSISCIVTLPGGQDVRIVAIHPEPPLPTRDTLGRDAEILLVGKIASEETLPTIVTGDLNDVAWSRTTRRFLRLSRLLDPRQGRGFFNSFDARRWYMRWPLDHIFHSLRFELVDMERLPFVGSDHFPMFYRFALTEADNNQPPPPETSADSKEADDVVATEKQRNRPPVGTDWE